MERIGDFSSTSAETEAISFTTEHGEELEVVPFIRGHQPDDRLKLSLIRKVSPGGLYLANRGWIPTIPNSFGLPPGKTCPGKTSFCESCYAFGSIRSQGVNEMLEGNLSLLESLKTADAMSSYLVEMLGRYDSFAKESNIEANNKVFRIHWSGDFYSEDYAEAWSKAVRQFPDVQFWVYTRSFDESLNILPILDGIPNLSIFLSVDNENIGSVPSKFSHLRWAVSAKDVVSAERLAREDHKLTPCPENLDRLKLMQDGEGACIKCRLCFRGELNTGADIAFVTSGKYDASPQSRFAHNVPEQPIDISTLTLNSVRTVQRERYVTNHSADDE